MGISIKKSDYNNELSSVGIKTMREELETGAVLSIEGMRSFTKKDDSLGHLMLIKDNSTGNLIRLPFAEYEKMACDSGDLKTEENDTYSFPSQLKVTAVEPRLRDGNEIFPIQAYTLWNSVKDSDNIDFEAVYAGGVLANHSYKTVKNYTVAVVS